MDVKDKQILNSILEAGRWAVSADNGQPWKFHWKDGRLLLALDRKRGTSFFDGRLYAPYLGFGSLIENLCIAAKHNGYDPTVKLFPGLEIDNDQIVAVLKFAPLSHQADSLYSAIFERVTNRRAYLSESVQIDVREALLKCAEGFADFRLVLIDDETKKSKLAALTAGAESVRFNFSCKDVHADFFKCLRFSKSQAIQTSDGLWVRCLEVAMPEIAALKFLSNWPIAAVAARLGAHIAFSRQSVKLLRRTPLIALVMGRSGDRFLKEKDFLAGGRLCQRLWLTATTHHLACQPMAALPLFFLQYAGSGDDGFPGHTGKKIGRLSADFSQTFGLAEGEELLMLFRLGYSKAPSAKSFRRPLRDMLKTDDNSPI